MENLLYQSIWLPGLAGLLSIVLVKTKGAEGFLDAIRKLLMFLVSAYCIYIGFMIFTGAEFQVLLGTLTLGSLSTDIILGSSKLGSLMVMFSGIFAFLIGIYSMKYRSGAEHNNWYYGLSLMTLAAANGVFLAADFFSLVVFWELSTLFLFGLIAMGNNEKTAFAAAKTFIILGFTEAAMLFAVAYIWVTHGTLVISELSFNVRETTNIILYLLMASAGLSKAGAMPFHSWIPTAAEGAPISVMAYLPASIDKLLGIFFLFLVSTKIFVLNSGLQLTLMIIGVVTIIVSVMMAMLQHDLRKLLAYHAVSQVGYMVLGIGTGHPLGILAGLFHMLNHTLYKNTLFLCAGVVEKQTGITNLEKLGGLGKKMPVIFFANFVAAMAISGVPPFNGFVSKWMVYHSCIIIEQPVMFILAIFGSALTLASFIKVLHSVYLGPLPDELKNVKSPGLALTLPPLALSLICILFGLFPGLPVMKLLAPGIANVPSMQGNMFWLSFGASYWKPLIAFGLLLLGLIVVAIYYAAGKAFKTRKDKAFIGGIEPGTLAGYHVFTNEKMRIPGTGFYNTIKELPILKTILPDAEHGAFDPYRYTQKTGYALFVKPLRVLHNGVLSSYLSWVIIGLVAIFIILI